MSIGIGFARGGYVYPVYPVGGVDVNEALGSQSPFPEEQEVAVPGGISVLNIMGAHKVNAGKLEPIIPNSSFTPR